MNGPNHKAAFVMLELIYRSYNSVQFSSNITKAAMWLPANDRALYSSGGDKTEFSVAYTERGKIGLIIMKQTVMLKQPRQSTIIINNYCCIGSKALVST